MIDVRNALPLICEWPRMVKACPTIAITFIDAARWTATTFVIWDWYRYRSAWRADEHIGLDNVHGTQVIRSMDAALRRLKSLPGAICLSAAASILDGDRALPYDVIHIPGMIMPCTCRLAGRCLSVLAVSVAGPFHDPMWSLVPTHNSRATAA
jgi:hypothetical protein